VEQLKTPKRQSIDSKSQLQADSILLKAFNYRRKPVKVLEPLLKGVKANKVVALARFQQIVRSNTALHRGALNQKDLRVKQQID